MAPRIMLLTALGLLSVSFATTCLQRARAQKHVAITAQTAPVNGGVCKLGTYCKAQ